MALQNLVDAYLYKDLLEFGDLRNSGKIRDLLRLLAFQVGSEVSLTELGSALSISKDSVARYIDLLEKSFIIYRLGGFSRNLRKEISKSHKIYFYDVGVRNTLIGNWNPVELRDDLGKLWENFLMVERMKFLAYTHQSVERYFWRTYTGAELDYVEELNGNLSGYEFKSGTKIAKPPASWLQTYANAHFTFVNRHNYLPFILGENAP